jgi:hypothetical protein
MNLPIVLLEEMPLWYHWVGTIGAIVILIALTIYTIFIDDRDMDEIKNVALVTLTGVIIAVVWAAGWGLIIAALILTSPAILLYGLRMGWWNLKDWLYYKKYDM